MSDETAIVVRHARVRWVGAPLLASGVALLGYALFAVMTGGSMLTVGLGMFGCGLALASFGANHDTAMALAFAHRDAELPPSLMDELSDELERDRDGIVHGQPMPKVAMVMPIIAMGIQALVAYRLFGPIA